MSEIRKLYQYKSLLAHSSYERAKGELLIYRYGLNNHYDQGLKEVKSAIEGLKERDRIIYICNWVHNNTTHDGKSIADLDLNNIGLRVPINCYSISLLLNIAYLSVGLISRMVQTLSADPCVRGNHWVNSVFSWEKGDWIMVDATFDAYCESKGKLLSVEEIREKIKNNEKFDVVCLDYIDKRQYYYLICETYYQFNSFLIHTDFPLKEEGQRLINLAPSGFDSKNFYGELAKMREDYSEELEFCDQIRLFTKDQNVFWRGNHSYV